MKGEASPFSWIFRFHLDRAFCDVLSMYHYRRSNEELQILDDLYNDLATFRSLVRQSDTETINLMLETPFSSSTSASTTEPSLEA